MEELIIKYLSGEAADNEVKELLKWIELDKANFDQYNSVKLLWIWQSMPNELRDREEAHSFTQRALAQERKRKRGGSIRWLVAASLTTIILTNLWFLSNKREQSVVELSDEGISQGYYHEIYTEKGVKSFVVLPDSSRVWLNSDSRIIFPDKFTGPNRVVRIASGEFFFEVKEMPERPMIVHTDMNFKIEVKGTSFNVRSYKEDNETQTTLISGSIQLIKDCNPGETREVTTLSPNDSYIIRKDQSSIMVRNAEVTNKQVAWREGRLIFESTPLYEVIRRLERWHGSKFCIEHPEVLEQKITATFNSESIVQIMEMIKFCSPIDYNIQENTITLKKK